MAMPQCRPVLACDADTCNTQGSACETICDSLRCRHLQHAGQRLTRVIDTSASVQDSPQAQETQDYIQVAAIEGAVNGAHWNGGITSAQRAWLRDQLSAAEHEGVKCIVACHHPVGTVRSHSPALNRHLCMTFALRVALRRIAFVSHCMTHASTSLLRATCEHQRVAAVNEARLLQ